jgi:uncharacterized repeat protein (TIGR01451 family)
MKNLYAFLIVVFFTFDSNAQIVNIPDPYFKNLLVNTHCTDTDGGNFDINGDVDTNDDGEIQVSEALEVKVLEFEETDDYSLSGIEAFTNLEFIYFVYFNFSNLDLTGVPWLKTLEMHTGTIASLNVSGLVNLKTINTAFTNFPTTDWSSLTALESFQIWEGTIPSLDLSNLPNLKEATIIGSAAANLPGINVSGLTNLETLTCSGIGLTTLDISDLVNLKGLSCSANQLTSLDLSHANNLTGLECNNNLLTSLDVSNLTLLESLNCGDNQLTDLDITHSPLLRYLYCPNNQLTALDLSNGSHIVMLYCGGNQLTALNTTNLLALQWVGVSSNLFTSLDFSYSLANYWSDLNFSDNPNLTHINVKNGAWMTFHQYESFNTTNCPNLHYICADEMNFWRVHAPEALLNSYCTFAPGGAYNTISGTLTFDMNNNGCDAGDVLSLNSKMKISDGFTSGVTFADASGNYAFYVQTGNFTLTPAFENPYFIVSPASAVVNFPTNDSSTQIQNFCITPNGIHNDVEITIIATARPRPGFDTGYRLVYKNKGNQMLSGEISFTFDDSVLDFVSADPALTSQALNTLKWSYNSLLPFETRAIDFILNVNSPQETPPVNIGDQLNSTVTINPVSGDDTPADNTFALTEVILGSFDPNDKTCLEGNTIAPERVGDYLHYIIRFQNSGTAPAENIVVKDVIDTAKFDMASFELTDSSHPHLTKISGNVVEFQFPNINLPTETEDEPGSHGYVAFKIKTKNNLVLGNAVENKADIYFDYNFPIETNTATTTVALLANDTFESKGVSVFPNPVKDQLHIMAKDNITTVQLYDVQGRLIETVLANDTNFIFALDKNAAGVYFVKIYTDNGVKVEKIIKE